MWKETIMLLESTKQIIDEVKNSEKLELVEAVLMHCSVVKKWLLTSIKSNIYVCTK